MRNSRGAITKSSKFATINNNSSTNRSRIISECLSLANSDSSTSESHVDAQPTERHKIIPELHTRLRSLRHVIGFRTYNLAVITCGTMWDACVRARGLLCSTNETLSQAVIAVSREIDQLRIIEDRFYKECDRIIFYEKKAQEIKFWKENIEACIMDSMHAVHSLFNETSGSSSSSSSNNNSSTSIISSSGSGSISNPGASENYRRIQQILDGDWKGHSRYLDILYEIHSVLLKTCTQFGPKNETCEQISKRLRRLELMVDEFCSVSTAHRMAHAQEYVLFFDSEYVNYLIPIEDSLRDSFLRKHAAAEELIELLRETQNTARSLQIKHEQIKMENAEAVSSQMFEEERMLLEFIDSGREHERREQERREHEQRLLQQQQQQLVLFDQEAEEEAAKQLLKFRNPHQFDTQWSAADLVETPPSYSPVWTRSWVGQIRILK